MSILNRVDNEPVIPPAQMAANRLINMTKQTYNQMTQAYNMGTRMFWQNLMGATPEEIASELGTDAKEVFELHYKLGQLLASVDPNSVTEANNMVGNFTINDDGTVTINN